MADVAIDPSVLVPFEIHRFRTSDGYEIGYRKYPTPGVVKARIIILHGIQSHSGWYLRSCSELARSGYEVYFLDRRGSGLNIEQDRAYTKSFRRLLDDIQEFRNSLPQDPLKCLLFGISWGGKLAVALQYRWPGSVDGIGLLCPGLAAKVKPPLVTRLRIALARTFRPRKQFPIPLNDPTLFTGSPDYQSFIRNDTLALQEASARLLAESFLLDLYIRRAKTHVTCPTLLMLAEKDRIIDNEKIQQMFAQFPSTNKRLVIYPDSEHTLEFESSNHPFVSDLIAWLDQIR